MALLTMVVGCTTNPPAVRDDGSAAQDGAATAEGDGARDDLAADTSPQEAASPPPDTSGVDASPRPDASLDMAEEAPPDAVLGEPAPADTLEPETAPPDASGDGGMDGPDAGTDAPDARDTPDVPRDLPPRSDTPDAATDTPDARVDVIDARDVSDVSDVRDARADAASDTPDASDADRASPCPSGRVPCGGRCADLRSDPEHCGACGNRCGGGLVCRDSVCQCATPRSGSPGVTSVSLRSGGRSRSYRIYAPPTSVQVARPVVFNFHGIGDNGAEHQRFTEFDVEANERRVIVVYPDGEFSSWNARFCCPLAATLDIEDLQFFDAMVDGVSDRLCVDPRRVYVTGFSNGAMMAQHIACRRSSRVAAVAGVAGTYDHHNCELSRPMPVLYFHSTEDRAVPYGGGAFSGVSGVVTPSVANSMNRWRNLDGCSDATATYLRNTDGYCYRWLDCRAPVQHCRLEVGGHDWPRFPRRMLDANVMMLDFFADNPLP
ncbi:MAG: hypothetical protein HY909_12775 [Deltaproteobacteria bacterium]|nr:hypothetical protein [Deltaproteobacteria bacterium]